ncbi:MAG: hypothetical protein R2857_15790 [Vampirovibrionales bacterium]
MSGTSVPAAAAVYNPVASMASVASVTSVQVSKPVATAQVPMISLNAGVATDTVDIAAGIDVMPTQTTVPLSDHGTDAAAYCHHSAHHDGQHHC